MIVVVVGLGAVITGIIRNYVSDNKQVIERTATDVDCATQVQILVPKFNDAFMICHNASTYNISFTLENTGSMAVDELQVKVFGEDGFQDFDGLMPNGLAPGQVQTNLNVTYTVATVGAIQQVQIIPKKKVEASANKIYCSESGLTFSVSDISPC